MLYWDCVTSLNVAPLMGAPPFNVCVERSPTINVSSGILFVGVVY
jgi:hypothetical protein